MSVDLTVTILPKVTTVLTRCWPRAREGSTFFVCTLMVPLLYLSWYLYSINSGVP